jgi:hypothetical protein
VVRWVLLSFARALSEPRDILNSLCAKQGKLSAKRGRVWRFYFRPFGLCAPKHGQPRLGFSRPGLSFVSPTARICRRGSKQFGKRTCKPNSVVCGHSSRRRVAADTHQRPTRRFRPCMEQPERAPRYAKSRLGASGRCAAPLALQGRFPPYLVLLRVGFTLPRPLQAERCALTAPFHPYPGAGVFRNGERTRQAGPTRVLRFQGGPPAVPKKRGGVAEAVSFLWHWPSMGFETHVPDVIRHTALRSSDFPPPVDLAQARSHRQRPPGPPASSDFTAVAALNPCCHVPDSSPIPRC